MPAPTAAPLTAAMYGFSNWMSARGNGVNAVAQAVAALGDRLLGPQHAFSPCLLGHVHAAAEAAAGAGEDDDAHVAVRVRALDGVEPLRQHQVVEGVQPLGPVQRDGRDAIRHVVQDVFVLHGGDCTGQRPILRLARSPFLDTVANPNL